MHISILAFILFVIIFSVSLVFDVILIFRILFLVIYFYARL